MAVSVRFENVSKSFGATRAADGVTLAVAPGQLFFLLGPSGCGKTTLLRCLAGFCAPDAGRILIGDRDVTRLPPYERDAGMVFQSYALWPHMTVRENVAFGLEMRRIAKPQIATRVSEALAMVRMADRAGDKPNQLSGGQQQRVALARALVIRPQCLLLDEPLSNLDAQLRLEMRAEIRRICKEAGLTAIYVTHDQKEALSIADRLAVLEAGRVRQIGEPREVYLRPASRFVAGFIGETNFIEGAVLDAGDGLLRAGTPAGVWTGTPAGGRRFAPGDAVTLSVRPEAVRLGAPPADAPNRFEGTVHHTVYLGEVAQHQVTLRAAGGTADALNLKALELNPRIAAHDRAEPATVWVAPEDVVALGE